jgi:hypothetical protein
MNSFLVVCLCGLVFSILAGMVYLVKTTVSPPKTPYDLWLSDAQKQSTVKLNPSRTL